MIEAQQEEEESDSFMTYYLGIFYRDDYRKKSVAFYNITTWVCVKIPEPKRANFKNKQRLYKEPTRGHSTVKLSQAHFQL